MKRLSTILCETLLVMSLTGCHGTEYNELSDTMIQEKANEISETKERLFPAEDDVQYYSGNHCPLCDNYNDYSSDVKCQYDKDLKQGYCLDYGYYMYEHNNGNMYNYYTMTGELIQTSLMYD